MSLLSPSFMEILIDILKKIGGFLLKNWHIVLIFVAAIAVFGLLSRACNKPPKLNEQEIQQAQTAIDQKNDQKLREILTNSDVREAQIDANLANAKNATVNAAAVSHEKYANMTTDQLAAEIEKRK